MWVKLLKLKRRHTYSYVILVGHPICVGQVAYSNRDPVTVMVAVRPSLLREVFKDGNSNCDPVTVTVARSRLRSDWGSSLKALRRRRPNRDPVTVTVAVRLEAFFKSGSKKATRTATQSRSWSRCDQAFFEKPLKKATRTATQARSRFQSDWKSSSRPFQEESVLVSVRVGLPSLKGRDKAPKPPPD